MIRKHPIRRVALIPWMGLLVACAVASAAVPSVDELERRYPKASIVNATDAQRALTDAAAVGKALDERYAAERGRCVRVFLATQCLDQARRAHTLAHTRIRRIEVEAHDFQRQQAATQRQSHRQIEQARQHDEVGVREEPGRKSGDASKNPLGGPDPALASASRQRFEQRSAQHEREEAARVQVQIRSSADNAIRFQDKQARARAYATDRARAREENEKSRAEHEQERKRKYEDSTPAPP